MVQCTQELIIIASFGLVLFTAGCCFALLRILQDAKRRAEIGESLASRYCVLPLYERLLTNIGFLYLIDAIILCAGNIIAMYIPSVHWSVENINMCGIVCASYIPFRSHYSIWSTHSDRKVFLCLLVWLIAGTSLISFPRSKHMDRHIQMWSRVSAYMPALISGIMGIYQALQATYSRPNCLYSVTLLLAYALTTTLCELLVFVMQFPHTTITVTIIHAVFTITMPVALLCDARGDTARWTRFGKINSCAIYDSGSTAPYSPDLELGCFGKLYFLFGRGIERKGNYGPSPSPRSRVMYNTNRYILNFADVGITPTHQTNSCEGIFRSQRVTVTVLSAERAQEAASPEGVDALKMEMLLYLSLQDESVLQEIGFCFAPPTVLKVSELCDKGSLHVSLRRDREVWAISQRRLSACADLCRAVAYAHSVGVLHGNISTRNIMVTSTWALKLTGFEIPHVSREQAGAVSSDLSMRNRVDNLSPPRRQRISCESLEGDMEALGWTILEIWSSGWTKISCSTSDGDCGVGLSKDMLVQWLDSHTDDSSHSRSSVGGGEHSHILLKDLPRCLRLLLKICFSDSSKKSGSVHTLLGGLYTDIKRAATATKEGSLLPSSLTHLHSPTAFRALQSLRRGPESRRKIERSQHAAIALDDFDGEGEENSPNSRGGSSPFTFPAEVMPSNEAFKDESTCYADALTAHYVPVSAVCLDGSGVAERDERSVVMNPLLSE